MEAQEGQVRKATNNKDERLERPPLSTRWEAQKVTKLQNEGNYTRQVKVAPMKPKWLARYSAVVHDGSQNLALLYCIPRLRLNREAANEIDG